MLTKYYVGMEVSSGLHGFGLSPIVLLWINHKNGKIEGSEDHKPTKI